MSSGSMIYPYLYCWVLLLSRGPGGVRVKGLTRLEGGIPKWNARGCVCGNADGRVQCRPPHNLTHPVACAIELHFTTRSAAR